MKINISCVIATHNRDEYLKEAIYSVINQTFLPLEIIVSNNVPNKKNPNSC
jgi:glycosyltransferase involved in cell wall biosynthesis